MDKSMHKMIEAYVCYVKDEIASAVALEGGDKMAQIVYSVQLKPLVLDKEAKPRSKTVVPEQDRCLAMKAGNMQCTRRKTATEHYCGTHIKGLTYGVMDKSSELSSIKKREIWAEDIRGIIYWIDVEHNVYKTEDVQKNITDPKVIGTWTKEGEDYRMILHSTKN